MATVSILKDLAHDKHPRLAHEVVHVGGHPLEFTRVWLRAGPCMVAVLDSEQAPEAVAQARRMTGWRVVKGDVLEGAEQELDAVGQVVVKVPTTPQMPPPISAALRNGWSPEDLVGAGDGEDWGPGGGFAARTGLTMAEMAVTVPPEGWGELAETRYPWTVEGWTAPDDFDRERRVPSKGSDESVEGEQAPEVDEPDDEPEEDAVEPEQADEEATAEPESDDSDDDVFVASDAVLALVEALLEKQEAGKPLHVNKVNYHLKKHGLDKLTSAQLRSVLSELT